MLTTDMFVHWILCHLTLDSDETLEQLFADMGVETKIKQNEGFICKNRFDLFLVGFVLCVFLVHSEEYQSNWCCLVLMRYLNLKCFIFTNQVFLLCTQEDINQTAAGLFILRMLFISLCK